MSSQSDPKSTPSINSWLEEELYQQYQHDRKDVPEGWQPLFESGANGTPLAAVAANGNSTAVAVEEPPAPVAAPTPVTKVVEPIAPTTPVVTEAAVATNTPKSPTAPVSTAVEVKGNDQLVPLRGAALRIAENMTLSLQIPTATSQRFIPIKLIDENRRIINHQRAVMSKSKVSYTHIIAYAIVKAIEKVPAVNTCYAFKDNQAFRVTHPQVNIGIAIDVPGKDGNRSLMVPSIKQANKMSFDQFIAAYDDLVMRARGGKLTVPDFEGTTISLTNPGTIGTVVSVPRLMPGQGAIIATGAIDYPAEFAGVSEQVRAMLGLAKTMGITCTYDHRVIQGAESGMFLGRLQGMLDGADNFYENIFKDLKVPYLPVRVDDVPPPALLPAAAGMFPGQSAPDVTKEAAVIQLIHHYRVRGHLIANLDPLGSEPKYHEELDPRTYGLTMWDLDRTFYAGSYLGNSGQATTLREVLETLRQTYCGRIAVEYMHIQHPEEKSWLQQRMELTRNLWPLGAEVQKRIAERLIEAEEFEHFLDNRFKGHKRFSVEGGESAIAILDEVLEKSADANCAEVVIGMAHRGRLTVLANIVGKSMQQLFSEFDGDIDPESIFGSGDVKYHLGATGVRRVSSGREIAVSLAFNPSHLEAVNPVVEGIVRPKQDRLGDAKRERVIPVLIHGDAAFAGQGVVFETLNLSQLEGYATGGTFHLVINNQIGFTTNPYDSRSSQYCTDVARAIQAPIFHVNADDPEACVRVAQLAFDYRQKFKKDAVIDMVCYRKHGHNEADDPSYTQPLMYEKIKVQPSVIKQYTARLEREKTLSAAELQGMYRRVADKLNWVYDEAQRNKAEYELQEVTPVTANVSEYRTQTAIDGDMIARVLTGTTAFPETFTVHPKLAGFLKKRRDLIPNIADGGGALDWAAGETLAFGSLVLDGTPVRLSGQDSGRGTFSQRHLEFFDYATGAKHVPMQHLAKDQAKFQVWDSSLSEFAVMGFEFGYSVADPMSLVLWEGQFGDFANGAQIIIDQFIAPAESKWGQPSGLVLLLPHGYEGQGPEHSSARIERFLQLCAENNMQVANCSTPAQYFHILRRQMYGGADRRGVRKPLIIFTPKSILRNAAAVSPLSEFMRGSFREVLSDPANLDTGRVKRVLLCSGKVYYDLAAERAKRGVQDVAIVRMEQLYPFPAGELRSVLTRYPESAEMFWVQEEPKNMGAWRFMVKDIQPMLDGSRRVLRYVGRAESASPAAGSLKRHQAEQAEIVEDSFSAASPVAKRRRIPVRVKKGKK